RPTFSGTLSDLENAQKWAALMERKTSITDVGNQKALRETYESQKAYVEATERPGRWEGDTYVSAPPEPTFTYILQNLTLGMTRGDSGGIVARTTQKDLDRVKKAYLECGSDDAFTAKYYSTFYNIGLKASDAEDKWLQVVARARELCGADLA